MMRDTAKTSVPPKRDRKRSARAAVIAELSMTAERWAAELAGREPGTSPPDQWPDSDPFVRLALLHGLSFADLSKLCAGLAVELEERAVRTGYDPGGATPNPDEREEQ